VFRQTIPVKNGSALWFDGKRLAEARKSVVVSHSAVVAATADATARNWLVPANLQLCNRQ
jgi:hypothetical protein